MGPLKRWLLPAALLTAAIAAMGWWLISWLSEWMSTWLVGQFMEDEGVIQALMAKLPFDDPDVDAHAQEVLMTAITLFYPEFVLGLGDEATTLLPSGGGGDAAAFADRMMPDITNLIMRPMARGQELPERLRGGTFMTAVATLQGKLLAEPSLAPFTLRAEARALARRALW